MRSLKFQNVERFTSVNQKISRLCIFENQTEEGMPQRYSTVRTLSAYPKPTHRSLGLPHRKFENQDFEVFPMYPILDPMIRGCNWWTIDPPFFFYKLKTWGFGFGWLCLVWGVKSKFSGDSTSVCSVEPLGLRWFAILKNDRIFSYQMSLFHWKIENKETFDR